MYAMNYRNFGGFPAAGSAMQVDQKSERCAFVMFKKLESRPNWPQYTLRGHFEYVYKEMLEAGQFRTPAPFDSVWPLLKVLVESSAFVAYLNSSQPPGKRINKQQLREIYTNQYTHRINEPALGARSVAEFNKVLKRAFFNGKLYEIDGYVYIGDTESVLAEALSEAPDPVEFARRQEKYRRRPNCYCPVCDVTCFDSQQFTEHLDGRRHKVQQAVSELRDVQVKNDLIKDKHNLRVHAGPNSLVDWDPVAGSFTIEAELGDHIEVSLRLTHDQTAKSNVAMCSNDVIIDEFLYFFKVDDLFFNDAYGLIRKKQPLILKPGSTLSVQVTCQPVVTAVRSVVPVMFVCRSLATNEQIRILRFIKVECVRDKKLYKSLMPVEAFKADAAYALKPPPLAAKQRNSSDNSDDNEDSSSDESNNAAALVAPLSRLNVAGCSSASSSVPKPSTTAKAGEIVNSADGKTVVLAPTLKPVRAAVAGGLYLKPIGAHPISERARRLHKFGSRLGASGAGTKRTVSDELLETLLTQKVDESNLALRFELLLHLEEVQMAIDIQRYAVENAKLVRVLDKQVPYLVYTIRLPGIIENRPCVIRGDLLLVTVADNPNTVFEAVVDEIDGDQLRLLTAKRVIQSTNESPVTVHFQIDRLSLRLQHETLQILKKVFAHSSDGANRRLNALSSSGSDSAEAVFQDRLRIMLFPSRSRYLAFSRQPSVVTLQAFFNRQLNEEQRRCVRNIVLNTHHPVPFLIFGPPGTGKTVTLSEAVKQVYNCHKDSFLLVCAPENTSADHLVQTICSENSNVEPRKVLRLYAATRHDKVPDFVSKPGRCTVDFLEEGYPTIKQIKSYRIVITTLNTASKLAFMGFQRDHFTHLFIDEAAHAMESEAYIPIAFLLNLTHPSFGQLIMAGDPRQLGVTVRSIVARKYHLECSLLERLITKCELYLTEKCAADITRNLDYDPDSLAPLNIPGSDPVTFDDRLLVKLRRNYRSHAAIIEFSRKRFYHGELDACADEASKMRFVKWEMLPNPDRPVIFHPVIGSDEREGSSPSYFNRHEIMVIDTYLQALLVEKRGCKIEPKDIGIITPYKGQNVKIRKMLEQKRYSEIGKNAMTSASRSDVGILVGTVEEFQGQERAVIIISAVRSSPKLLRKYAEYQLGFINRANSDDREMNVCSKRLNVALTRAKSLLIVIGNPFILEQDNNWKLWLEECESNGLWAVSRAQMTKMRSTALVNDVIVNEMDDEAAETGLSMSELQEEPQWTRRE